MLAAANAALETTVAVCTYKPKNIQLAEMITMIK